MTSEEKKRIIAAATPWPWEQKVNNAWNQKLQVEPNIAFCQKEDDAAFIVAARTEWPKDFERVQKLESYLRDTQYHQEYAGARYRCKSCGRFKDQGCTSDCELDSLLREGRG